MLTPSAEILAVLAPFASCMTQPTFAHAQVLVWGTLLAPGPRTVAAALRVLGLAAHRHFTNFHRVLNRNQWSALALSRILLAGLLHAFVPPDAPLCLVIDETLERRQGPQLTRAGWFRDAVRSTATKVVTTRGLRWVCVCLLVAVPWSARPWALPFLVVLSLSKKTAQRLKVRHRSPSELAAGLLALVHRWQPTRAAQWAGDGGYATVALYRACQRQRDAVSLVTRLRWDAALYAVPEPQPASKRGPKPQKGVRLPNPAQHLQEPTTLWERVTLAWYGGTTREAEVATGTCLWYTPGHAPVRLRWVLVRPLAGSSAPFAPVCLGCSVWESPAVAVVGAYVGRWNIEVTFAELRAHLGFETQRSWADKTIQRSTPCLCGLFSVAVLSMQVWGLTPLQGLRSSWYPKEGTTFSDVLATVRLHLWEGLNYAGSSAASDSCLIPQKLLHRLRMAACYAP